MHICYKMCLLFLHFIHSRTFEQKAEENKIGWKKYGQCIITFTTCQQCFQCFANWFPYVVHWTGLIWQWLNDIILLEWEFNSAQFNAIMPSTINHHQTGSRHLKINFWSNIYMYFIRLGSSIYLLKYFQIMNRMCKYFPALIDHNFYVVMLRGPSLKTDVKFNTC